MPYYPPLCGRTINTLETGQRAIVDYVVKIRQQPGPNWVGVLNAGDLKILDHKGRQDRSKIRI